MSAVTKNNVTDGRILIITQEFDPHADKMVLALRERGVKPIRFHTKDFPVKASMNIRLGNSVGCSVIIDHAGGRIDAGELKSVWYRRPDKCELPNNLSREEREFATKECDQSLFGMYRILGGFWVNPPDNNRVAGSKILQIRTAAEIGLRVPETLVTNVPDEAVAFHRSNAAGIIMKPQHQAFLSAEKKTGLYTSLVDETKLEHIALVKNSPCLFQENIPKKLELRVTVIGSRIFTAALLSQATNEDGKIDWRRAAMESIPHEPYALPADIERKLLQLMLIFGLNYAAIDMIVTPDGDHVFLEINPNGQFGWIQDKVDFPLYETLADLLIAGEIN